MLNIYAQSFMTATRTDVHGVKLQAHDSTKPKRRWLPKGHWWVAKDQKF